MDPMELENKHARVDPREQKTDEKAREGTRKRHLWDENDSLKAKIAKESEKIIKMKVHTDAVNWELNNKLQVSEENNEKLKSSLLKQQTEYENLVAEHQSLVSTKSNIQHKVESTLKLTQQMVDRAKSTIDALRNVEKDKIAIKLGFEHSNKQKEEFNSHILELENTYCNKLCAVQLALDDKCAVISNQTGRIVELNNCLAMAENINKETQRDSQLLKTTNASLTNQIKELIEKASSLQEKYNELQEETAQNNKQSIASLAEAEKQCSLKTCENNHLNEELLRANNQISSLNDNIVALKEEIVLLENKRKEQQLSFEDKLADNEGELVRLHAANEALQEEVEKERANQFKVEEEYVNKINKLNTDAKEQQTENEEMYKAKQNIEDQLKEKCDELVIVKKKLEDLEVSKQKLQEEIEALAIKNNDDNENFKNLYLEKNRVAEARDLELNSKIKSLQDHILIKSEEHNELQKQYKEMCEVNKKNSVMEKKYNSLLERHEVIQRELRNLRMRETKLKSAVASPLVGSSSMDKEYSSNTPKQHKDAQVSNSLIKAPATKQATKKPAFCSDSDESDCYRYDSRMIQKRFESLAKAEQMETVKKVNSKTKK